MRLSKFQTVVLLIVLAVVMLGLIAFGPKEAIPAGIRFGNAFVDVEVALSPIVQARGLSGRKNLAEAAGMLFVYPESQIPSFWMKDMNFALDIIWLDENLEIVDITYGATPESYPQSFTPNSPVRYVLEVNSGFANKHNLAIGNTAEFSEQLIDLLK